MNDLVDTTEMYLRTVYELEEEGIVPLRARIAERLEQSGPTVSQTVARMERDGLLIVRPDRSLEMTTEGRARAIAVMRKHRLAERLLTDILGMDLHQVHDEACRWEHVMSDEVERHVIDKLDNPTYSPFGNPIPGLDELGYTGDKPTNPGVRAADIPIGETWTCTLLQFNEILQNDRDQYSEMTRAGASIGTEVEIANNYGHIVLSVNGTDIALSDDMAHAIRIEQV